MKKSPFYVGLALITGLVLALEVLDTRLLSLLTWYSVAFFVIAMGLFGLTAGAVRVYLAPERYAADRLGASLSADCRATALGIPVSYCLLLILPLRSDGVLTVLPLYLAFASAIALPFYPAGAAIAAALTRSPFPVGRVYAVDLAGAALGAPLVALLLQWLRGGTAILALGVLAALAAVAFARSVGDAAAAKRSWLLAGALAALTLVDGVSHRGLVPLWVKGRPEQRAFIELELWNNHSRVVVSPVAKLPAALWGPGSKCQVPSVRQRGAEIDGHAATPLYLPEHGLEELRFLDCDITNAVHAIRRRGSLAVIGVGGSRDLQAGLLAGHAPIVGVELNARLLEILRGPLGRGTGIVEGDEVELVHAEARSWLAGTDRRFDVIQMSLIDTWAATGAGAHALGENGLYTLEGWRVFLSRLQPGGVFTVSRWSSVESLRMMSLAVAALLDRGITEPSRHLVLMQGGQVSTLLLSLEPFSQADLDTLWQLAVDKGFFVLVMPGRTVPTERDAAIFAARNLAQLTQRSRTELLDFSPPTDDRPFFFNVIRLPALWRPLPSVSYGPVDGNLIATRTLGLSFLVSLLLVSAAVIWPLTRRARPSGRVDAKLWAALAYFGCIGVGFMLAEIALLQRTTLVLGHPSYSLLVVLPALVASAGLGSLLSDRLPVERTAWCLAVPLVIASALTGLGFGWHALAPSLTTASEGLRFSAAIAACALPGLLMGMAFPVGMRVIRRAHGEETPWLWGINGVGSVLASSVAVMLALTVGLTNLTLIAAGLYLLLIPCVLVMRRAG